MSNDKLSAVCLDDRAHSTTAETTTTTTTTTATTTTTTSTATASPSRVVVRELLVAAVDDNSVTLSWQPAGSVSELVTYELSSWRADDVTVTSTMTLVSHSDVTVTMSGLTPDTRYCFTVSLPLPLSPSVCVCVCLSVCVSVAAACPHYCTDPDVIWGCPLVVHYWADLQSIHGLCCYGNSSNAKCQRVLVLAVCLVSIAFTVFDVHE